MKILLPLPVEVRLKTPGPGSKSTVPLKLPVKYILPLASISIACPKSVEVPPKDPPQMKLPVDASNFWI